MINFNCNDFWCNEYGLVILQNRTNRKLFAKRPYYWMDRVILIDESKGGREIVEDRKESTFHERDWEVIYPKEERQIKRFYSEIEQIRRDLKLNELLKLTNSYGY